MSKITLNVIRKLVTGFLYFFFISTQTTILLMKYSNGLGKAVQNLQIVVETLGFELVKPWTDFQDANRLARWCLMLLGRTTPRISKFYFWCLITFENLTDLVY